MSTLAGKRREASHLFWRLNHLHLAEKVIEPMGWLSPQA